MANGEIDACSGVGLNRGRPLSVYQKDRVAEGLCMADSDGDCDWTGCPQTLDGEPKRSGRSCPRWVESMKRLDPDDDGKAGG